MIQWDTWEYRKFLFFLKKLGIKSAIINNKPSILRGRLLRLKINGQDVAYAKDASFDAGITTIPIETVDRDGSDGVNT